MTTIRVQASQWTVGVLCALIGMLALVTPHQFSAVTYAVLQPNLELWGAAFVLVGAGLIGVANLGGSRRA